MRVLLVIPALMAFLAAEPPLRIALDTQAFEWQVSLDGGGSLLRRDGKPLRGLAPGEKVRLWWDGKGAGRAADLWRVQVGAPVPLGEAEARAQKLRTQGWTPDLVKVSDGGTWRVLVGRFAQSAEAERALPKLVDAGFPELWVASEPGTAHGVPGRGLYLVTERYERHPLPRQGVRLKPRGEWVLIQGKGRYRGTVEILPNAQGALTLINEVPMETYLRGVVPREMGPGEFPALEALKAQAVAARTYAHTNRGKRAKEGFDLLDTVADQVYGGRDAEHPMTDRAVLETRGLIATFQGRPIQALFMANGGGATIDNDFVFGKGHAYLKGVSSYAPQPKVLPMAGLAPKEGLDAHLSWDLLRLVAAGVCPLEALDPARFGASASVEQLQAALNRIRTLVGLPTDAASRPALQEPAGYLGLARGLGFGTIPVGQVRPQDGAYFLGSSPQAGDDALLATFLTQRGVVPPAWWGGAPTQLQAWVVLARLWQELQPAVWLEGTLLADGRVRPRAQEPVSLDLRQPCLVVEEAPGGSLRAVASSPMQVGDKVKVLSGGSSVLVRRLDPDGASWDRYNPTAHWRQEVKEADLLARLKARVGFQGLDRLEATWNDQGRVTELVALDGTRKAVFTGMRIRHILGLKDNVFRWIETGARPERRWIFFGRGWGHGVGMDQTGAYGMALEGHTVESILKHYYQGIELTPLPQ